MATTSRAAEAMSLIEIAVNSLSLCLGAERIGRPRPDMEKNAAETLERAVRLLRNETLAPCDTTE